MKLALYIWFKIFSMKNKRIAVMAGCIDPIFLNSENLNQLYLVVINNYSDLYYNLLTNIWLIFYILILRIME